MNQNFLFGFFLPFLVVPAMALPCHDFAASNIEKTEKVYPLQLLNLHKQGAEIPNMKFSGPGICYAISMSGQGSEEKDFIYDVLGNGKGGGQFTYLKKEGRKEAMLFRFNSYPYEEEACQLNLKRDSQFASHAIATSYINQYNSSTHLYLYQSSRSAMEYPEEREIRMVAGGKGLTVHIVSPYSLRYTICYFPKR
ncbi:MAG TPA: hypothetical protein VIG33_09835 [Pseudobdellovibrionaceae bacterium]|jgi:hypothetical protein